MSIIVFDTETTGQANWQSFDYNDQPRIIEMCAVRLSDDLLEEGRFCKRFSIPEPIPHEATLIHGISNLDIVGCLPFEQYYIDLVDLFWGCRKAVAHNIRFDMKLLKHELERCRKITQFPFPPNHYCTMNATRKYSPNKKWMSLEDTYTYMTGQVMENAHSAESDVDATIAIVKAMQNGKTDKLW